jgi:hypothetical protein
MRGLTAGVLASAVGLACYDPGLSQATDAPATVDAVPTIPPPGCPPDYVLAGKSCYRIVAQAQTWVLAEADCEDDPETDPPAHLVVIDDEAENEWVRQALPADRWIGLWKDTRWTWVSGVPVLYTSWLDGVTPASPEDDCAEMKSAGAWSDDDCTSDAKTYVCEQDSRAPSTLP